MALRPPIAHLLVGWLCAAAFGLAALSPTRAPAQTAPFDLAGPTLVVSVAHAGATLPIAEVPNLSPGDQLSIRADFPPSQSVQDLLIEEVVVPESWFFRDETWTRKGRDGLHLTYPRTPSRCWCSWRRRRAAISGRWWARCAGVPAPSCGRRKT